MSKRIPDVLPLQDHYYLLSDGTRFARHGTNNCNGVLVFTNLERAEQFRMTVGRHMNFEPRKVTADEFLAAAEKAGAFCLAEGTRVRVCQIIGAKEKAPCDVKLEKQKDHLGEAIWKLLETTDLPWSDVCDVLQTLQQRSPAEWKALEEERDSALEEGEDGESEVND